MKICSRCGASKTLTDYSAEKRSPDGRRSACKVCISRDGEQYRQRTKQKKAEYDIAYRSRNKDALAAYKLEWRRTHAVRLKEYRAATAIRRKQIFAKWAEKNKERLTQKRKSEYRADPGSARSKAIAWRKAHPETAREYRKRNAEKLSASYHRRRALKLSAGGAHTAEQINELLVRQKFRCVVCRGLINKKRHKDHIVPLSAGGTNDILNIQLLCPSCNLSKHDRDPLSFMQSRGFLL